MRMFYLLFFFIPAFRTSRLQPEHPSQPEAGALKKRISLAMVKVRAAPTIKPTITY